jgi:hypothetical protein
MGRLGERQSAARTSDASADVALLRREEISKAMTSAFYRLVFSAVRRHGDQFWSHQAVADFARRRKASPHKRLEKYDDDQRSPRIAVP